MGTTFHTYTTNLVANLKARPGLAGVIVEDGPPSIGALQLGEWIAFLDVHGEQNWVAIGNRSKDETYTIDLMIDIMAAAGDNNQTFITNRAVAILAEIEDELKTNPSQGVASARVSSQVKTPFTVAKRADLEAGWRETMIAVGIEVLARI